MENIKIFIKEIKIFIEKIIKKIIKKFIEKLPKSLPASQTIKKLPPQPASFSPPFQTLIFDKEYRFLRLIFDQEDRLFDKEDQNPASINH